jgi:hypothetical protein
MVDLLDNFLNLTKLFLAVASDFMKSLLRRMGGGEERKMNGGLSTSDQVKDEARMPKQQFFQTESAINNILSSKLSAQRDAEYLGLPGIK